MYISLPNSTKKSIKNFKDALEEKFQTTDYKGHAHQKFQERKQKYTEVVTDYGSDVHRSGITRVLPELHQLIVYSNPNFFHEPMTLAKRLEGLGAGKSDNTSKNILLLEGIHDRLQKLEITQRDSETTPMEGVYAV